MSSRSSSSSLEVERRPVARQVQQSTVVAETKPAESNIVKEPVEQQIKEAKEQKPQVQDNKDKNDNKNKSENIEAKEKRSRSSSEKKERRKRDSSKSKEKDDRGYNKDRRDDYRRKKSRSRSPREYRSRRDGDYDKDRKYRDDKDYNRDNRRKDNDYNRGKSDKEYEEDRAYKNKDDKYSNNRRYSPNRDNNSNKRDYKGYRDDRSSNRRRSSRSRNRSTSENADRRGSQRNNGSSKYNDRNEREGNQEKKLGLRQNADDLYGKKRGDKKEDKPEENEEDVFIEQPCWIPSGILAQYQNNMNGVTLKFTKPLDAEKPKESWSLYPFKGDEQYEVIRLKGDSAFLVGKDPRVCYILCENPTVSSQHAVIQFREIKTMDYGIGQYTSVIRPYIMDLESTNGTVLNNEKIDPAKYIQLLHKDVLKFGHSNREYVVMKEN